MILRNGFTDNVESIEIKQKPVKSRRLLQHREMIACLHEHMMMLFVLSQCSKYTPQWLRDYLIALSQDNQQRHRNPFYISRELIGDELASHTVDGDGIAFFDLMDELRRRQEFL